MVGGTTSGYSLMGRRHIARKPSRKISVESTPAKIGRRMKKLEKFMINPSSHDVNLTSREFWIFFRGDRVLGRHRHARTHTSEAVDDDSFVGLEARADDALSAQERPELHR